MVYCCCDAMPVKRKLNIAVPYKNTVFMLYRRLKYGVLCMVAVAEK